VHRDDFAQLIEEDHLSVAVAESMTAGELACAIVDIEGSGEWFRGGVVAYETETKYDVLHISRGPVISAQAVLEMAAGAAALFGTDVGIATSGCAGPLPMEDQPVGTLWIGVDVRGRKVARQHMVDGASPAERRAVAIDLVFADAVAQLTATGPASGVYAGHEG
jgi:PncC family amidohydrolase